MSSNKTYSNTLELVEAIKAGDSAAEIKLVEKYQAGLFIMLLRRSNNRQLAEEVLQDSWLIIIQKIRNSELRDASRLNGFVTQIARNQLTMAFRRCQTDEHRTQVMQDDIGTSKGDGQTELENKQLGSLIANVMGELSQPRDRELLLRFYYYGDDKNDLCEKFQLEPASFDAILARARNRFKQFWEKS